MVLTQLVKFFKGRVDENKKVKNTATVRKSQAPDEDDIVVQTFRMLDTDSGFLDESEMLTAMQHICGDRVTSAMVNSVMKEIDIDNSGAIQLKEFYDIFEKVDGMLRDQEVDAANIRVLQLSFSDSEDGISITCTSLAGEALCEVMFLESDLITKVPGRIAQEIEVPKQGLRLVLPNGNLFSSLSHSAQVKELLNH